MGLRNLILLTLLLSLFPGGAALSETLQVTDMSGRAVSVPHDPKRIICLGPGTLRLIVYLEAQDKVIGVEALEKQNPRGRPYWLARPELHDLPLCGPGGPASINQKPNMEVVLNLNPDLIFVTYMDSSLADEVQDTLQIPVVVLSYGSFATFDETVFEALHLAGRIVDQKERAESVIQYIQREQKALKQRSKESRPAKRPRAYVGGIGYRGAHGLESSELEYAPFDWVLVDNAAAELKTKGGSHIFISQESLINLDPEWIFIDGGGYDLAAQAYRKKPEVYNAISAFAHNQVYVLHPFNWYTTNIGTVLTDAYAVGKTVYPAQFANIDLAKKANAIYTKLVGAPVYEQMVKDYGPLGARAPLLQETGR
ncbi:MAG: iron ABC transporter substrate-binding protein [Desulfovermiculus sp.]